MRTAILANTLPAALPIYEEIEGVVAGDVFVVLFPAAEGTGARDFIKHIARLVLKKGRSKSLGLLRAKRLIILPRPLDHPRSLVRLSKLSLDVGLHKSGNIYREATLNCFRLGILNSHIGLLPAYRGRSVMEWAMLEDQPAGISVFFIDAGIDTGERIVFTELIDISHCETLGAAKKYLFNLDAGFYRRALELLRTGPVTYQRNDLSGRRYYVMSKLFNEVASQVFLLKGSGS